MTKSTKAAANISTRIFLGCQLNSEVRIHLNNSASWKREKALPGESQQRLEEIRYRDQDFIGFFLRKEEPSLEDLKEAMKAVQTLLQGHCGDLKVDSLKTAIFPQVFLA